MREFHHIGIPVSEKRPDMGYVESIKVWVTDPQQSDVRVEYLYFDPDSPLPDALKTEPHAAFMVDDLDKEVEGMEFVVEPTALPEGLKIAFFYVDGMLTEYCQAL